MIKSKFVSLGDIHLLKNNPTNRKDDLTEVQWIKLMEVFDFAASHQADVVINGDLFDNSNDYYLINRMAKFISSYKRLGVDVYAVFGQHDLKYRNREDTNLEILSSAGLIKILSSQPEFGAGFNIYGASWKDDIPIPVSTSIPSINILAIHAPISPTELFHGHNYIDLKTFTAEHPEFSLILCGDIHRTFMEQCGHSVILNSGPLIRKSIDEYNMIHKPGFFFIDMESISINLMEVKHRPASEVLDKTVSELKKERKAVTEEINAELFLNQLKEEIQNGPVINIKDRIIRWSSPESTISDKTKSLMENLLNGYDVERWLTDSNVYLTRKV